MSSNATESVIVILASFLKQAVLFVANVYNDLIYLSKNMYISYLPYGAPYSFSLPLSFPLSSSSLLITPFSHSPRLSHNRFLIFSFSPSFSLSLLSLSLVASVSLSIFISVSVLLSQYLPYLLSRYGIFEFFVSYVTQKNSNTKRIHVHLFEVIECVTDTIFYPDIYMIAEEDTIICSGYTIDKIGVRMFTFKHITMKKLSYPSLPRRQFIYEYLSDFNGKFFSIYLTTSQILTADKIRCSFKLHFVD